MFAKLCFSVLAMIIGALVPCASVPSSAEEKKSAGLDLPEGVIHIALPPGNFRMENIKRNDKFLIRLTAGKLVIEAKTIFMGDGKGATHYEATKKGIHWVPPDGGEGFFIDGVENMGGGETLGEPSPNYIRAANLKSGSLYLTTPSVKFIFGKPPPKN